MCNLREKTLDHLYSTHRDTYKALPHPPFGKSEPPKNLDHLYSTHRDTYKALPRPPFGKSDHNSIRLNPAYKQKLKQEAPVALSIKKRSDEADAKLQKCFASTDWNMFWDSSDGNEEYTTSVTGFINKCIDDIFPKVTVQNPTRSHGLQSTFALSCHFQGARL